MANAAEWSTPAQLARGRLDATVYACTRCDLLTLSASTANYHRRSGRCGADACVVMKECTLFVRPLGCEEEPVTKPPPPPEPSCNDNRKCLEAFLDSELVTYGDQLCCPMEDFRATLKAFLLERFSYMVRNCKFDMDFFRIPFLNRGLRIQRARLEYRGARRTRDYVMGMDLVHSE